MDPATPSGERRFRWPRAAFDQRPAVAVLVRCWCGAVSSAAEVLPQRCCGAAVLVFQLCFSAASVLLRCCCGAVAVLLRCCCGAVAVDPSPAAVRKVRVVRVELLVVREPAARVTPESRLSHSRVTSESRLITADSRQDRLNDWAEALLPAGQSSARAAV